jgi:hypothetical protein
MNLNWEGYMRSIQSQVGMWEPSQHLLEDRGKPIKPMSRVVYGRALRMRTDYNPAVQQNKKNSVLFSTVPSDRDITHFFSATLCGESGSSVSSVCLRAGRPGDRGSIPSRGEWIISLASVSRPSLRPTQTPVQWVPGVLSPELKRGRGVTPTTHPHLMPRSRMSRSYTSFPPKRLRGV